MTDIIERAEAAIEDLAVNGEPLSTTGMFAPIVNGLVAELKTTRTDLEELLAVATLYLDAFKNDEMVSLTELGRLGKIEEIIKRRGKRY